MKIIFKTRYQKNISFVCGMILIGLLAGCAFPGFTPPTATPTATLEPSTTPTITNTPEPTLTATPAESPTPTLTATPTIQYAITIGDRFELNCKLIFEENHLVVVPGCEDIQFGNFLIRRGEQYWFAIFIPGNEATYIDSDASGWIKLQEGELSQVDTRGRMFSCSPPGFGEYVCTVIIQTDSGPIPLQLSIQAALE
jgi:hypothetical protein